MAKEIERKFILGFLPEGIEIEKRKTIYQSYLAVGMEEVRIRKVAYGNLYNRFYLTYKNSVSGELSREEIEIEIGEETYEQLNTGSTPVIKERLLIKLKGGLLAEVDIFSNTGFDLKTVEVEFASEEAAVSFSPPEWFGRELTGTRSYTNQGLWKRINGREV